MWTNAGYLRGEHTTALFGSDRLFNITDVEELLRSLGERKFWSSIRPEVLRMLIDNAKGDVLKISRFVFVSEYYDCVKNNFVELAKIWEDPRLALSAFGATLTGLAGDIIQHLGDLSQGSDAQSQATGLVEIAYLSALLCDPYLLPAYRGLASFYLVVGKKDQASGMCRQYDATEKELLQTEDPELYLYREVRYKPLAAATRKEIDRVKAQLGLT
ncbi:MAG TPA: hypothetical protein VFB30_16045 [Spirochaetia bacterium]|nr:hypothetical protein [Spirochaetia bacterium]